MVGDGAEIPRDAVAVRTRARVVAAAAVQEVAGFRLHTHVGGKAVELPLRS